MPPLLPMSQFTAGQVHGRVPGFGERAHLLGDRQTADVAAHALMVTQVLQKL